MGSSKTATAASASSGFGYVFGTTNYTDSTGVIQFYSASASKTYYIPTSLTTVTITGGNILYGAFDACETLTSITLQTTVTTISDCAFRGCTALTSISIPATVTSIGANAFASCSALATVNFGGSESDWNNITINATGNGALDSATKNYTEPATEPEPTSEEE